MIIGFLGFFLLLGPSASAAHEKCDQVTIRAIKTAKVNGQEKIFQKFGSGTITFRSSDDKTPLIITNEHVIADADRLEAICGDQVFSASAIKGSVAPDLAVVRIDDSKRAPVKTFFGLDGSNSLSGVEPTGLLQFDVGAPVKMYPMKTEDPRTPQLAIGKNGLFSLGGVLDSRTVEARRSSTFRSDQNMVAIAAPKVLRAEPGKEFTPQRFQASVGFVAGQNIRLPVLADRNLVIPGLSVHPGMSGTRVEDADGKYAGMITRTFTYENGSAGLPAAEVSAIANSLLAGVDPYGPDSGHPFYLSHNPKLEVDGKSINQTYQLNYRRNDGSVSVYQDICPSGSYAATAQWEEVSGDYQRPSGDYQRPSGDYQRPSTSNSSPLYPPHFEIGKAPDAALVTAQDLKKNTPRTFDFSFYHPAPRSCQTEGIRMPNGKRLVGFHTQPGRPAADEIIRLSSVDALYLLAKVKGPSIFNELERNGIFADDKKQKMDFICDSPALTWMPALGYRDESVNCRTLEREDGTGPLTLMMFTQQAMLISDRLALGGLLNSILSCEKSSGALHFESKATATNPVTADLRMTSDRIKGSLKIGSCEVKKIDLPKDFWSARIQSKDMDVSLDIMPGGEGLFIRLIPHDLNSYCLPGSLSTTGKVILQGMLWSPL